MNHLHIEAYLMPINAFRSILGQPIIKIPTDDASAQTLIEMMSSDISPENLHCDGEISASQADKQLNLVDINETLV